MRASAESTFANAMAPKKSENRSGADQGRAFAQYQSHHLRAGCAERRADGDFFAPLRKRVGGDPGEPDCG